MRIHLRKNIPEADKMADGELVRWKRVKFSGEARKDLATVPFTGALDLRARILRVNSTEHAAVSAELVGAALVHKMATCSMTPFAQLFQEHENATTGAEWLVSDSEHVSGLLHRAKEASPFTAQSSPPDSPGFGPILEACMSAVQRNVAAMFEWNDRYVQRGEAVYWYNFDTHTWPAIQDEFNAMCADFDARLAAHQFFEYADRYASLSREILRVDHDPHPDFRAGKMRAFGPVVAARAQINYDHQPATQCGVKLMARFGREYKAPRQS